MKRENGAIILYVTVACLLVLVIGCLAYLGVANRQAMQIAELNKKEQGYNNTEVVSQEEQKASDTEMVPVYTPQQFALVGSGEEAYVEQENKFYVFGIDKTYMFYGVAEELTQAVKEQLSE